MIFSVFLSILFSIFGFFIIFLVFNHQNNKKYIQYNERRLLSEKPSFLRTTYLSDLSNSLNRKYCKLSSVWPTTISNSTVEIPCPNGFTGFAYRYCSEEGVWKSSNYFNCFPNNSREIESDLYLKVKSLKKQTQLLQSTLSEQPLSIIPYDEDIHSFYYPPLEFTEKQNVGVISPVMNLGSALISHFEISPSKIINNLKFDQSSGNITGTAITTGSFTYNVTAYYIDDQDYTINITINITPLKCPDIFIANYDFWNSTDVGSMGYNYCRRGYMGFRKRMCLRNAVWDDVIDESDCKELDYALEPDKSSLYIHYTLFVVDYNYTIVIPNVLYSLNSYFVDYFELANGKSIYLEEVNKVDNPIYSGKTSVTNYEIYIQSYLVKIRIEIEEERLNDFDINFPYNISTDSFYNDLCEYNSVFLHGNIQHMSHNIVERKKNDYTLLIIIIVIVVVIIVVITATIIFERYRRTHVKHIDILYIIIIIIMYIVQENNLCVFLFHHIFIYIKFIYIYNYYCIFLTYILFLTKPITKQ